MKVTVGSRWVDSSGLWEVVSVDGPVCTLWRMAAAGALDKYVTVRCADLVKTAEPALQRNPASPFQQGFMAGVRKALEGKATPLKKTQMRSAKKAVVKKPVKTGPAAKKSVKKPTKKPTVKTGPAAKKTVKTGLKRNPSPKNPWMGHHALHAFAGKFHVSTSDEKLWKALLAEMNSTAAGRKQVAGFTPIQLRQIRAALLAAHHKNQRTYSAVMRGNF